LAGREPTLLGFEFFREVVALQEGYADGVGVVNILQTNGTLLDDEWCRFLAEEDFLVGISIDGPERLHNRFRRTRADGATFEAVMGGLKRLREHGVEHSGDVYACDHFVDPGFRRGNIHGTHIADLIDDPDRREFGEYKREGLPPRCESCDVPAYCHGGCPKNWQLGTPAGEPGLNYLRAGYRRFFTDVQPYLDLVERAVEGGLPLPAVMDAVEVLDARDGRAATVRALPRGAETQAMRRNGTDGDLGGRAGWVAVVALAVCLVGFPVAILVWPPTFVPYRDAYLALAMVPAVLLGLVGVWLAVRTQ